MTLSKSQEQTIYRCLKGRIQLGFYEDGERFPSVQEIARYYGVSACPAQRALKALERDGILRLTRGNETIILRKPYGEYLKTGVFRRRLAACRDLNQSLRLLYPSICYQGLRHLDPCASDLDGKIPEGRHSPEKRLYGLFEQSLRALGSRMITSLSYDMGAFIESGYIDIFYQMYGREEAEQLLERFVQAYIVSGKECGEGRGDAAKGRLQRLADRFFEDIQRYLDELRGPFSEEEQECFHWEAHKGRTKYCDVIAIDFICKINQGTYPVGRLLPAAAALADTYHVSVITIRRTLTLLNRLGLVKTLNGVGTRVLSVGDSAILCRCRDFMLDEALRLCLEALQLLAITCEDVLRYTLPLCSNAARTAMTRAAVQEDQKASMVAMVSACLQAVARCCPLAAVREIYEKITLALLGGGILRLDETGSELVPRWAERAAVLLQSLETGDTSRFAREFHALCVENFMGTKHRLLEMGIAGVKDIADPV